MADPVTLPLWLFLLILAFAAVTFASHFLFPSVRWFLRRRLERAVARLNTRLKRPIEPFKLVRRHDTIQRLIYDRDVLAAVAEAAAAQGIPEEVAHERARGYAREIVPAFSAFAYFGLATRAARWLSSRLYEVRVADFHEAIDGIDPAATVVFVVNHRSNLDYVLVTHLVADRAALSYAVGEWARIWPLAPLIRATGAYFIRRNSRDPLYRRVLGRYVAMATAAGVTQAVFPEGGLSLTGRLQPPRLGLLSYILEGHAESGRDVVFVPVALNYDRVIEDRVLTEAAAAGVRRFRARLPVILHFWLRHFWMRLRGRFRRFGTAAVGFGAPLSLSDFLGAPRTDPAAELGAELMARIAAVMPVLPVPLVAAALLAAPGPLPPDALARAIAPRLPPGAAAEAARAGAAQLLARRLVVETPGGLAPAEGERALLAFYAASVAPCPDPLAAAPQGPAT